MAKNRYIDTRFWHDTFIREHLNPLDRYLFLYFLTNDKTNISGIYELPISIISSETGIEIEMIKKMLVRLEGKIHYIDGWIYIINFQRYQNINSPKVQVGIDNEMAKIPLKIKDEIKKLTENGIGYLYGIDTQSHLNSNLNSNSNSMLSEESETKKENKKEKQTFDEFMKSKGFYLKENEKSEQREEAWFRTDEFKQERMLAEGLVRQYQKDWKDLNKDKTIEIDVAKEIWDYWNSFPTIDQTPFKGTPANPSVKKILLPHSDHISYDLRELIRKNLLNYPSVDMFKKAIQNYMEEILNRKPTTDSSYHLHRLSIYDFFLQKNGFVKFANR